MIARNPNLPKPAQRKAALTVAKKYLTGTRRAEAMAWIREPARSGTDLSAFLDRIVAAYETKDQHR